MVDKNGQNNFLYPHSSYRGKFETKNFIFNANLQEFAQKVSYISNLETAGKITPVEAYQQMKNLWKKLETSKEQLGIGEGYLNN